MYKLALVNMDCLFVLVITFFEYFIEKIRFGLKFVSETIIFF